MDFLKSRVVQKKGNIDQCHRRMRKVWEKTEQLGALDQRAKRKTTDFKGSVWLGCQFSSSGCVHRGDGKDVMGHRAR
jgi:hypothetical protein